MDQFSTVTSIGGYLLTATMTLLGTGWFSAWFLARMRDDIKDLINNKIQTLEDNIVHKLEYHERHDDERFSEIRKEIVEIRIRDAAREAMIKRKPNE